MSRSIWATLGIKATHDATEIRRAYARRLKEVHPEDDPEGFQALRAAYDQASNMARHGWAVPKPRPPKAVVKDPTGEAPDAGADDEDDDWYDEPDYDAGGWHAPTGDRWSRTDDASPPADPVLDAEQAREAELAKDHRALCDQLAAIGRDPAADRQEALTLLIRIFRSPAMHALRTHDRTERWLAQLVGHGGPSTEELIEPVIQFFGWDSSRIGVDLSHAQPVLRRRAAADAVRRLEWRGEPEHGAWQALKRKPTWSRRLVERFRFGFSARVSALLQRIDYDLPDLEARMNPEAAARWRARLARPVLGPFFLWTVLLIPPIAAAIWNANGDFGPPNGWTFAALWTVFASALFGLGVANLYWVARPRQAWRMNDPWGRPLWQRFGWAPAALAAPLLAGLIPGTVWLAPLLLLAGLGLWGWARVTSGHVAPPHTTRFDWSRFAGIAPIAGFLLLQTDATEAHWLALSAGFAAAVLALQSGAWAIADERMHQTGAARLIAGGQLALAIGGAAALLASAASGMGAAPTTGLIVTLALADRALAWNRVGHLLNARRLLLLLGWIGGFLVAAALPYEGFGTQAFVGLGLWLLLASTLTALSGLIEGLDLFSRFRSKTKPKPRGKPRPGDLA